MPDKKKHRLTITNQEDIIGVELLIAPSGVIHWHHPQKVMVEKLLMRLSGALLTIGILIMRIDPYIDLSTTSDRALVLCTTNPVRIDNTN